MSNKAIVVGDSIEASNAGWSFGGPVAESFDSHVRTSIPFYTEGHDLITKLSDFFLNSGSLCYDLGCSTGQLLRELAEHHDGRGVEFIGYDNQAPMIKKSSEKCSKFNNVFTLHADLLEVELKKSDLIISYYTMQFIHPKHRQKLFADIYASLNWGGGFLLFEKTRANDARFQDITSAVYMDYKLDQGYTPEEIVGKTRSLKGVLEPFSTQGNVNLLKRAGFIDLITIFKYVCFEGFLAIK